MIIITSIILCVISFSITLWITISQRSRYSNKIQAALAALVKSTEHERKLQEEINALQIKVKHSREDPVTQLPSWQLFEDRLRQGLKESERYQLVLGLLIIDLDEFKLVNSITDYKSGDQVLHEVATRLKRCIRQVDSVSRFNKDTFVVMITRLSRAETAAVVAQRILQTMVQPFEIKNESLRITASIGIATFPHDGQDGASLMLAADHALKVAKSKGMHRYEFFQEEMYNSSRRILQLSSSLNSESVVNDFALHYQPIINTANEEIICMDTLLSWEHPELGTVSADELLDLAGKQHKIARVAEWLITAACQQFVRWRDLGFRPALLGVSLPLNLLQSTPFVCRLSQIMKETNFDPAWLLLQVKANARPLSSEELEKSFNMLRYMGVKLAIDDFGTGTLSLFQLKEFPVNYFKLDKTLLSDVGTNPQTAILIQSILELAHNLGAQLIVQGVETQDQLKLLRESGCTLMEGKALGAPLSEEEVVPQ